VPLDFSQRLSNPKPPPYFQRTYTNIKQIFDLNNIFINMRRKRYILEQEEELTDFKKILLINKKKLPYDDVEFYDSKDNDFSNVIEVTQDGLIFTFDGLKDYLEFFFPDEYVENSEGEYDAINYEYMYSGNYDFRNEYWDRVSDDWNEGYVTGHFNKEHYEILSKIFRTYSPRLYSLINSGKKGEKLDKEIANFLESFPRVRDDIESAYVDAHVAAVENEVKEGIEKTYCDFLSPIGIKRYSERYCFWKYELPWGSAMMIYARYGDTNDNLLDLLFDAIKKTNLRHLPYYYEMQYNFFNQDDFNEVFNPEVTSALENFYETLLEDDSYSKKYLETIDKVLQLGGFDLWIRTKDGKYKIKITDVDKDTLKVTYFISDTTWDMNVKRGVTDIDSIYNLLYQQSMWSPKEFREHFFRFLSNSVL